MLLLPSRAALEVNRVYHSDALLLCSALDAQSVDMILCDLPYGTTACSWDVIIPFEPMWAAFKRVIKPRGAIVLTASQPFTSALVMSNPKMFKYDIVWHKTQARGFLNAKVEPLREHEDILVFGRAGINYYPQIHKKTPANIRPHTPSGKPTSIYGQYAAASERAIPIDMSYPRSVITFANTNRGDGYLHPTQKPVALFEYLIRTYTQAGDVVLDPTCGSGTTAIAARNTGRNFICGDSSAEYVAVARKRLDAPYTLPMLLETA